MYNVFSNKIGNECTWIYVESDDLFIARCLLINYYENSKNIKFIGKFEKMGDIEKKIPDNYFLDGYCFDTYLKFKMNFLLN